MLGWYEMLVCGLWLWSHVPSLLQNYIRGDLTLHVTLQVRCQAQPIRFSPQGWGTGMEKDQVTPVVALHPKGHVMSGQPCSTMQIWKEEAAGETEGSSCTETRKDEKLCSQRER